MILYKGSQHKLDIIKPSDVHQSDQHKLDKIGNGSDKVVFATPIKRHALPYAALSGSLNWTLWVSDEPGRGRVIQIDDIDWKGKVELDKKVYLYTMNSDKFTKVSDREYMAFEDIEIIDVEELSVEKILKQYIVYVPTEVDFNKE